MDQLLADDILKFPDFGFMASINLTQDLLWSIFTLFFIFYVFMTLIFVYHWHRYDTVGVLVFVGEVIYFVGSVALLLTAGLSISAF